MESSDFCVSLQNSPHSQWTPSLVRERQVNVYQVLNQCVLRWKSYQLYTYKRQVSLHACVARHLPSSMDCQPWTTDRCRSSRWYLLVLRPLSRNDEHSLTANWVSVERLLNRRDKFNRRYSTLVFLPLTYLDRIWLMARSELSASHSLG